MPYRKNYRFILGLLISILIVLSLPGRSQSASAQSESGDWSAPVNLSTSGAGINPAMVVGASGNLHVLWQDEYSRFVYRFRDADSNWSNFYELDLPFFGSPFVLAADQTGTILVFWIDQENNDLNTMFVNETLMNNAANWSNPIFLASGVTNFDISIDINNQAHLVYLRARDSEVPSGVYYQRTRGTIATWNSARALYLSKYYRNLLPPEESSVPADLTAANQVSVNIETQTRDDRSSVFVSFENPSTKRIYYAVSDDNGDTWPGIQEVFTPSIETTYLRPTNLKTIAAHNQTLQLWGIEEPGGNCSLQFRLSDDGGQTWNNTQSLENQISGCPEEINWIDVNNQTTLFALSDQNALSLIAWNGQKWSLPQSQSAINEFIDPLTFDAVQLARLRTTFTNEGLMIIGKDINASEDIWFAEKGIPQETSIWFTESSNWSEVRSIELADGNVNTLAGLKDKEGSVHFLWTITDHDNNTSDISDVVISVLDDSQQLANTVTVLDDIPGNVLDFTLEADYASNRLALAWQGGEFGQIHTAWADLNQLLNPVGWSQIDVIGNTEVGYSPTIIALPDGQLYTIFSTPFGSEKGIYSIQSQDGGENWSDAELSFPIPDERVCPVVNEVSPVIDDQSTIHLLYGCSTYEGGKGSLGLFYTNSPADEDNWSTVNVVTEGNVRWSDLLLDQRGWLHQFWIVVEERTELWHSYSDDNGLNWKAVQRVSINEGSHPLATAVLDQSGQVHLLQVVSETSGQSSITYYLWDGNSWINREALKLANQTEYEIKNLTGIIDSNENLDAAWIQTAKTNGEPVSSLMIANIQISESATVNLSQQPEQTPQESGPTNNNPDVTSSESVGDMDETLEPLAVPNLNTSPSASTPTWLGAGLGIGIAFLFVTIIFVFQQKRNN